MMKLMKLMTVIAILANVLVGVLTGLDGEYVFTVASMMYGFSVWVMYALHVSNEEFYREMMDGRGR